MMLSPDEFTVGTIGQAQPLSLILPRNKYEATVLIASTDKGSAAVFLSGRFQYLWLESEGNDAWKGLIIPNVDIEVDEASLYDPDSEGRHLGSIIRSDTRLVVCARKEHGFGQHDAVTIRNGLAPTNNLSVGFSRWRVVVGADRRVVTEIDLASQSQA